MNEETREVAIANRLLGMAPERREAELDALCGDDRDLRVLVARVLADREPVIIDKTSANVGDIGHGQPPPANGAGQPPNRDDALPERVGRYRIIRRLGQGGFGVVYLASSDDGLRRVVALKVLKPGVADVNAIRRFHRERHILPSLHHPNIAGFLDADETENGEPYFVMEYVEGVSITDYCDRNGLTVRDRVQLFGKVCEAVQHAHDRLILHRDLKPSNILVDRDGVPKLLDFGIARFLSRDAEASSDLVTVGEDSALTPEYASPEHLRGDPLTVGSDVYSLGVILYELLAGQRPYLLTSRLRHAASKIVEDTRIVAPSDKLTTVVAPSDPPTTASVDAGKVATRRGTSLDRLRRQLVGDIDNIVLSALRKEPIRRYGSAKDLLDDIQRHLAGQAVKARGDAWTYRASTFVRRHRWTLAVLAVIVGAILWVAIAEMRAVRAESDERGAKLRELALEEDNQRLQEETRGKYADELSGLSQMLMSQLGTRPLSEGEPSREYGRDLRVEVAEVLSGIAGLAGESPDRRKQRAMAGRTLLAAVADQAAVSSSALTQSKEKVLSVADDAERLWSELQASAPADDSVIASHADVLRLRGLINRRLGDESAANADLAEAMRVASDGGAPAALAASSSRLRVFVRSQIQRADLIGRREPEAAKKLVEEAATLVRAAGLGSTDDATDLELAATVECRIGAMAEERRAYAEAVEAFQAAFDMRSKAYGREATVERRLALIDSTQWVSRNYRNLGRFAEARRMLDRFRELSESPIRTVTDAVSQQSLISRGIEQDARLDEVQGKWSDAAGKYDLAARELALALDRYVAGPDPTLSRRLGQLHIAQGDAHLNGGAPARAIEAYDVAVAGLARGQSGSGAKDPVVLSLLATQSAGRVRALVALGSRSDLPAVVGDFERRLAEVRGLGQLSTAFLDMVEEAAVATALARAADEPDGAKLATEIAAIVDSTKPSDETVEQAALYLLAFRGHGGQVDQFCAMAKALKPLLDRQLDSPDAVKRKPRLASAQANLEKAMSDACGVTRDPKDGASR
jgi:tetratricopeptide (TPR) repeat protein